MGGGEEPAGLNEAARPTPGMLSARPFVPCFALNQSLCGQPKAWPKKFRIFFVKFSDAKLSNFKHGLVEIQNMIMQVGKKIMQGKS